MIADEHVNHAAGIRRFPLEPHQQIHHVPRPGSAIEHVTDDDEMRLPARPGQSVADDARSLQRSRKLVVGAVDIAHRDDAVDAVEAPLFRASLGRRQ